MLYTQKSIKTTHIITKVAPENTSTNRKTKNISSTYIIIDFNPINFRKMPKKLHIKHDVFNSSVTKSLDKSLITCKTISVLIVYCNLIKFIILQIIHKKKIIIKNLTR